MFDIALLNCTADTFLNINYLADLFHFENTNTISKYVLAQQYPEVQKSEPTGVYYTIPDEAALQISMRKATLFQNPQKTNITIYDVIAVVKNNIDKIVDLYYSLQDEESKETLMRVVLSSFLNKKEFIAEISDNVVLLSEYMTTMRVENIKELLDVYQELKKIDLKDPINFRVVIRANGEVDARFIIGTVEQILESNFNEIIHGISEEFNRIIQLNQTVGEAFAIAQNDLQQGKIADAFSLMAICEQGLETISQIVQKYNSEELA